MINKEDLFGLRSDDLESARTIVEKAFEVALEPRHSSYHGGDYYSKQLSNKDEFILKVNSDGEEGGYAEEDYKDFNILLCVYSPVDCDRYKKALNCSGFVPARTIRDQSITHSAQDSICRWSRRNLFSDRTLAGYKSNSGNWLCPVVVTSQ